MADNVSFAAVIIELLDTNFAATGHKPLHAKVVAKIETPADQERVGIDRRNAHTKRPSMAPTRIQLPTESDIEDAFASIVSLD